MNTKLKPCKCGYSDALDGTQNDGFLALVCPNCNHRVEAFTIQGLADKWNQSVAESIDNRAKLEYDKLSDSEKLKRLEFWATLYLGWLNVDNPTDAMMRDVVFNYESTLENIK